MVSNISGERLIQRFRLFFKYAAGDGDSRATKLGETLAADEWIWILHAGDNARDSGGDDCVCAGRRASLVGAGFQVDVQSCAASLFSGLLEGENFSMFKALVGVAARAHNCAVCIRNHGADAWIGRRQTDALPGEVQGLEKKEFVSVVLGH